MKLDRNINPVGRGKYALVLMRMLAALEKQNGGQLPADVQDALKTLVNHRAIDFGNTGDKDFFVIRLKDKYAYEALKAYPTSAAADDIEYANQIFELSEMARNHPSKKRPD